MCPCCRLPALPPSGGQRLTVTDFNFQRAVIPNVNVKYVRERPVQTLSGQRQERVRGHAFADSFFCRGAAWCHRPRPQPWPHGRSLGRTAARNRLTRLGLGRGGACSVAAPPTATGRTPVQCIRGAVPGACPPSAPLSNPYPLPPSHPVPSRTPSPALLPPPPSCPYFSPPHLHLSVPLAWLLLPLLRSPTIHPSAPPSLSTARRNWPPLPFPLAVCIAQAPLPSRRVVPPPDGPPHDGHVPASDLLG